MSSKQLNIEVAYALPERQQVIVLKVPSGTTAGEAIEHSGILASFPDIALPDVRLGIFAEVVPFDRVLCEGDRVEIYRPLIIDPKESRRQRAAANPPQRSQPQSK